MGTGSFWYLGKLNFDENQSNNVFFSVVSKSSTISCFCRCCCLCTLLWNLYFIDESNEILRRLSKHFQHRRKFRGISNDLKSQRKFRNYPDELFRLVFSTLGVNNSLWKRSFSFFFSTFFSHFGSVTTSENGKKRKRNVLINLTWRVFIVLFKKKTFCS